MINLMYQEGYTHSQGRTRVTTRRSAANSTIYVAIFLTQLLLTTPRTEWPIISFFSWNASKL